jgi:hypothetical protein
LAFASVKAAKKRWIAPFVVSRGPPQQTDSSFTPASPLIHHLEIEAVEQGLPRNSPT